MVAVERVDLNHQVLEVLRKGIVEGRLKPGERLHVGRLAEWLDVSPTPVKHALGRLVTEGLVAFGPRGGAYVTRLTDADVEELFDLREMMEQFAAARAIATVEQADCDRLEEFAESLRDRVHADGSIEYDGFAADDEAFHRLLVGLAGNRRLADLYEALHVFTVVARSHYLLGAAPEPPAPGGGPHHVYIEHLAIVEALRAGNAEAVRAAMSEHLTTVRQFAQEAASATGVEASADRAGKTSIRRGSTLDAPAEFNGEEHRNGKAIG